MLSTVGRADLLELTAELIDIPSVSHGEAAIADFIEERLGSMAPGIIEMARIGNNICARTNFGLPQRLVLAGHLDTVPPNGNARARREGDTVVGLGATDMKSGLAVFLEIALAVCRQASCVGGVPGKLGTDLTWLFYVCEEVDRRESGLLQIEAADPRWLQADAAVLGEPTASAVEAGCQGVLRVVVDVRGERAHTARPWMGRNAIHQLGAVIGAVGAYEARRPVIDGCEYREALQAVSVSGGVANNVVPDEARLVLNHRFAPDRSAEEAFAFVRELVEEAAGTAGELSITLEESAAAAAPGLTHPLLAKLVQKSGEPPRAKLGWTDVSFFSSRGVPAANFGPGESTLAHTAAEKVDRRELERAFDVLSSVIA
ncbi:MAG: succinyl-diaminopimelate desuccinylase [Acidimicrobiales bacterium]